MTLARRGIFALSAALGASLLSGCGVLGRGTGEKLTEAAHEVDGVIGGELSTTHDGGFKRIITGTLSIEADDGEELVDIFDDAMRAIVTTIHDQMSEPDSVVVGEIAGTWIDGGEEVGIQDIGVPAEKRPDTVIASSFYERYGIS